MFDRKKDSSNFYYQQMKINNITSSAIVNQSAGDQDEAPAQNIYINESLTQGKLQAT